MKYVLGLEPAERDAIVAEALKLQAAEYQYDIPGLLRELARLLIGAEIPPGDKLLFCSGFCQAAYRNALGPKGDFAPGVLTLDTTPDTIWYSDLGNEARS